MCLKIKHLRSGKGKKNRLKLSESLTAVLECLHPTQMIAGVCTARWILHYQGNFLTAWWREKVKDFSPSFTV